MGRLVIFLGIILILVGGAGMVFGFIGVPAQMLNTISQATNPKAEDLCKPGEELVQENGAESYSPSMGYGHNVNYYCVNDAGVRREVTGDFVQGLFGQILPSLGGLAIPIISGGLCTFGFVLALLGFIFSRRRSPLTTAPYSFDGLDVPPMVNVVRTRGGGDLTTRLRQLDQAHQSGLITDAEYEQMRQQILASMK